MDTIIETPEPRIKNFVRKHKTKIAVIVTAATCMTINQIAVKQHNEFLKEHDLYDAFYTPEED